MPKKLPHLREVHNTYYCEMLIPKDVKHLFGNKTKFYRTTGCKVDQPKLAEIQAKKFVYEWKRQIQLARNSAQDFVFKDAFAMKALLKEYEKYDSKNLPKGFPKEHDIEEFKNNLVDSVWEEILEIEDRSGKDAAEIVSDVVFKNKTYLKNLIADWEMQELSRRLKPKTVDSRKSNIQLICNAFPTADRLFKDDAVKTWLLSIHSSGKYTASRIQKICEAGKSFYIYLEDVGELRKIESNRVVVNPFNVPKQLRIGKNKSSKQQYFKEEWIPLTVDEVICCYQEARRKEDKQLADLIYISAYTGMRIKEICSLKTDDIDLSEDCLKITDSKSHSGIRELPIHSKLKKRVRELIDNSDDGYLLSGLTQNKYTDRSNAIGKRFGRLKVSLGFPEMKVFHSIRKTVGTVFENNEVLENIVADIIGHSKPRMTYGKYSSGTNMKIKKEKIELLNYPWNKKVKTPLQISQEKEEVRKSRVLDLKNQNTS